MTALLNGEIVNCEPLGKIKKEKLIVGDNVQLEYNNYSGKYIVTKIFERKNSLIRPTIANIDQLFLIISKIPKTDYLLIDKLLIYCNQNNIDPYIIVNKVDLYNIDELQAIKDQYLPCCNDVIMVNAKEGLGINNIIKYLPNKLSAFAGQSAVGKSTIINQICPELKLKTNGLSKKIERGKHTTRHSEIYITNKNIMITDTPGFSMLNLDINIDPATLSHYYPEFDKYRQCRYADCDHTNLLDKDCAVAKAVNNGNINKLRYDRYVELYKICNERWRKKYD